ncbi:MAG TPA: acyl-CoA thioesterase, partial [Candidatus Methylomirabilis sp.]|nr:acyl-CoA thioesterase [Candidatus Methylomirabilis sp.]
MPEGFRFSFPIRVRYSEIDVQGIVYNSRYLEYVDVALTEYFRAMGV